jgi:hypothetical protein
MKVALDLCDVSLENYIASSKAYLNKPEVKKAIELIDIANRNKVEPRSVVTTRNNSISMYKEHFTGLMTL